MSLHRKCCCCPKCTSWCKSRTPCGFRLTFSSLVSCVSAGCGDLVAGLYYTNYPSSFDGTFDVYQIGSTGSDPCINRSTTTQLFYSNASCTGSPLNGSIFLDCSIGNGTLQVVYSYFYFDGTSRIGYAFAKTITGLGTSSTRDCGLSFTSQANEITSCAYSIPGASKILAYNGTLDITPLFTT